MKNIISRQTVIIALGSNLGHSAGIIQQAIQIIAQLPQTELEIKSSLYITKPIGYLNQPDFTNVVIAIKTHLHPYQLLQYLQTIELQFGRERSFDNAPRTLDIDIIDFNHQIINDPILTLPHPRAIERAFVMIPLAEIKPEYQLHKSQTALELSNTLKFQGVQKL